MQETPNETPLILTIDDTDQVRAVFRYHLEAAGYRVIEACDGKEGLERVEAEHPDLVLVDLRMPEMDGLEVLRHISTEHPEMPVIIISGSGIMEDAIQAIHLGAWDYLTKPIFDSALLKHTVEKTLDRSQLIKQNEAFRQSLEDQLRKIRAGEEAGRKIQLRLLPPAECRYGPYAIWQKILPSMLLSGDFTDSFHISATQVGFYFADVSGHGVPSALVTMLLKGFMTRFRDKYLATNDPTILDPAALLGELNKELLREQLDKHTTLFYGVLDTAQNTLLYCNCGQFPFPFLDNHDTVERIEEKNMPVGLFPFAEYQNTHRQLPDTFRLTLFSDGALDILEQETLEEKIRYLGTLRTEEAIRQFIRKAEMLDELPDDISIILIEKTGGET